MKLSILKSIFLCTFCCLTTIVMAQERANHGVPSPTYWQNYANYFIEAELDDQKHQIKGTVKIEYFNNSPYPLEYIWLHLDQNAFKENSLANALGKLDDRFSASVTDGMKILKITHEKKDLTEDITITDTRMQLRLKTPIAAKEGVFVFNIDYEFNIPEKGADRTGRGKIGEDYVYSVAQWYPRLAVFDDVKGWNLLPYRGTGEFYCEYGNFDYKITLPKEYIVAGAGELTNASDVLKRKYSRRLKKVKAKEVSFIVPEKEIDDKIVKTRKKKATWHFKMKHTRDVAWACSKRFIWNATRAELKSGKSILCMGYYLPKLDKEWDNGAQHLKTSIEFYSNQWYDYQYPTMSVVASTEGGIEYPAFTLVPYDRKGNAFWTTTDHEVAHNWFPMMIGTNEREHFWMDEGLVTFMGYYASQEVNYTSYMSNYKAMSNRIAKSNCCKSITPPDDYACGGFYDAMYFKPALGYMLLRETIIGAEQFDIAFSSFMKTWAFKHPTPKDLFQHFNSVTGENLNWFWEDWFNSEKKLDQAITKASYLTEKKMIAITLENKDELKMPVVLTFKFKDNSTIQKILPHQIWQRGNTFNYTFASDKSDLMTVEIDTDQMFPDIKRENNLFTLNGTE